MAISNAEAIALFIKIQQDLQSVVENNPTAIFSRLVIYPTNWYNLTNFEDSQYPTGVAYVTTDKTAGILIDVQKNPAAGPGLVVENFAQKIKFIDVLGLKLFSGSDLNDQSLSPASAVFDATLPVLSEDLSWEVGGDLSFNRATLASLTSLLTNYFNNLTGGDITRPPLSLEEFKTLVATQDPVPYNEFGRANGTELPDLITSRNGRKGASEIGTGGRGADAWYLKEFDILTNKKGKSRIAPGNKVGFTLNDYNAVEGDRIFINLEEVRRVFPSFSETDYTLKVVFSSKERLRAGKLGVELIYNTADGRLTLDANGKNDGFGRGGVIAKVGNVLGLRPEITEKDLVFVTPDALAGPSAPLSLA